MTQVDVAPSVEATIPMLRLEGVRAGFGQQTILHGVDLTVRRGEVAAVFGLNGAGKSVTLKTVAGVVPARSGRIIFDGRDVTTLSPEQRVETGMAHVPQGRQVFPQLSVEQNLRLGAYTLRRRQRSAYAPLLEEVYARFPILGERRRQLAGTMSGGQQASLAVARALMARPKLILVDEPTAGLAPTIIAELLGILGRVRETGVTILLVEQNVPFGLRLADSAHILQRGRVVHSGPVGELDSERLAHHLGVGRLLRSGVGTALVDAGEAQVGSAG